MIRILYLVIFLISTSIFAQADLEINKQNKERFISFVNSLTSAQLAELKIQLITVDSLPSVTTAFGHSALRVYLGKQFEDKDFYIDFGEYDESAGFIWRFLKGEAKFYITVKTMAASYTMWDTTGRGMYSSEFVLDENQKKAFLKNILEFIEKYKDGYEYNNFSGNCVTYIRDLIGATYGSPLKLETESNKRTWRSRVIPYSNKIFWLRIEEKLLLDHDTDKERNPTELIYLPYDLLFSLEDAKLVKDKEVLHRNFWKMPPDSFDFLGNFMFMVLVFIAISQIPVYFKPMIDRKGEILFGIVSGFGGLFALLVWLFTSFSFMNETIMVLVFTPIDFYLIAKKKPKFKIHMGIIGLRLLMLLLAVVLRFTIYKQNIDTALFFAIFFYALYAMNVFRANKKLAAI
ncbi:MAG TPA: DUF4105 domain-containing protein [Leptospiraceae bacterium]|nr:DUF4105 domain-containing protein [Leptospiraceae bacterium]